MPAFRKIPIMTCLVFGLSSPLLGQTHTDPTSVPSTNNTGVPNTNTTIPNTNNPISRTNPPLPGTVNPLPGATDPIPTPNGTRQAPTAEVITCPANQELVQQGNQMVCVPRTNSLTPNPNGVNDPTNTPRTR